jgi:protein SCO1
LNASGQLRNLGSSNFGTDIVKKTLIIIGLIVAIGLGVASSMLLLKPEPIVLKAATWFGSQARPLPAFELTDHRGKPFNQQTIKGKWQLMFFGYTNCPDICPDSLQMLTNMIKLISDESVIQQLQITFVSIDPDRDDLEKMKTYVTYFNPSFMSARGEIDEVNKLTQALGVMHYISKSADGSRYDVAHSGVLTLIDPQGRFTGIFSPPHDSAAIAHDLTKIINGK